MHAVRGARACAVTRESDWGSEFIRGVRGGRVAHLHVGIQLRVSVCFICFIQTLHIFHLNGSCVVTTIHYVAGADLQYFIGSADPDDLP